MHGLRKRPGMQDRISLPAAQDWKYSRPSSRANCPARPSGIRSTSCRSISNTAQPSSREDPINGITSRLARSTGAGSHYTTLELKLNIVRALTVAVPLVRAEGKVLHTGRQVATAEGRIVGPDGKLYAHATTTCLIFERTRQAHSEPKISELSTSRETA